MKKATKTVINQLERTLRERYTQAVVERRDWIANTTFDIYNKHCEELFQGDLTKCQDIVKVFCVMGYDVTFWVRNCEHDGENTPTIIISIFK